MKRLAMVCAVAVLAAGAWVRAAIIPFDLKGRAGDGLLPGNEPGVVIGGTGGEIGAGIFYDDVAKLLTINVGWGSSQGFTDLSSLATASHIHGPTASSFGNGFTETAGVLFHLSRSSNAVTGGVFTNPPILLTPAQEAQLLSGRYYINIHTANNPPGEMLGFLVPVPEPTGIASLLCLGGFAMLRRRR